MKKISYSLFLLITATLLLSSCGTQLSTVSITKRHYSSGYYVDINNTKHKTETASQKTIPIATGTPVLESSPVTREEVANNVSETTPVKAVTASGTIATPKNKNDNLKELTASTDKYSATNHQKQNITLNTLQELKNIQTISRSISSERKGHNGNNHSLLWTIIVILLILWLISFLMGGWGLGGLLNLLLVIALVLIILSLLGII